MAGRLRDAILADTRANQPAATAVAIGALYYVTDEDVTERSDGSAWTEVAINTTAHGDIDHTGITGVGAGGSGITFAANTGYLGVGSIPLFALNNTGIKSEAANRALLYPFMPLNDETVTTAYFRVGAQSGNMDIGIYNASLARLASTGGFAVPAIGNATHALTASLALTAGTLYYAAVVTDNTTATFAGATLTSSITTGRVQYRRAETSYPLPNPITVTANEDVHRFIGVWFA